MAVSTAQWWAASGVSQRKEEIEYESKVLEILNREWLELCHPETLKDSSGKSMY
jgi:hypothetical protein